MEQKVTVLIVEDEKHHAMVLRKLIENLDYEVMDWATNAPDAIRLIAEKKPDIVLIDIILKTGRHGFEVAKYIKEHAPQTPFIFMTSLTDKETVREAALFNPNAYLPKPYKSNELFVAIEMALAKPVMQEGDPENTDDRINDVLRNGCVFVRTKQTLIVKVPLAAIMYFEADRNYCNVHSSEKKYTIRKTLTYIEEKMDNIEFIRVHKSYIVNAKYIQKINYDTIFLPNNHEVPLGRTYKDVIEQKIKEIS